MPRYDYKCPRCGTIFEVVQKMKDKPAANCPKCGAKAERQLSGGHGIVFKGTGFYETDYKRAGENRETGEKAKPSAGTKGPKAPAAGSKPSGSAGSSGSSGSSSGPASTSGSKD